MSIYSGFATRNQQNYYDQVIYNLISTLLTRISKFYKNQDIDENSFFKIVVNQQKTLRKLEKRKYLQPKYAELIQNFRANLSEQNVDKDSRKVEMSRTMSVLDRQFNNIRQANEKFLVAEKGEAHSLTKIQERVKKSRKKSKSKKNSFKSNIDIFDFKAERKMPQLPSLQPIQRILTRTKFNQKPDFPQDQSRLTSDNQDQLQNGEKSETKIGLSKPPKFRAKMFFRYEPNEPRLETKQIMSNLIMEQRYRYLKVQKPTIVNNAPLSKPQTSFVPFEKIITPSKFLNPKIKTKIIKKIKGQQMNLKNQQKAQNLIGFNILLNLTTTNLIAASRGEAPPLSLLQNKQQGDYLDDGYRKQYPHYSNIIQLTQLPNEILPKSYLPTPKKMKQQIFTVEDHTIFRLKDIFSFTRNLFKYGSVTLQKVASIMNMTETNAKLLYDLFHEYFKFERGLGYEGRLQLKGEQKIKYLENVEKYIRQAFQEFVKKNQQESEYVPVEERLLSLRQVREYLNKKREEEDGSDSD